MKKEAANPSQQSRRPFFARLLEEQELDEVSGGAHLTKKYPSDRDDDILVTMKYPSDGDDDSAV